MNKHVLQDINHIETTQIGPVASIDYTLGWDKTIHAMTVVRRDGGQRASVTVGQPLSVEDVKRRMLMHYIVADSEGIDLPHEVVWALEVLESYALVLADGVVVG